jgi:hypothetical protein
MNLTRTTKPDIRIDEFLGELCGPLASFGVKSFLTAKLFKADIAFTHALGFKNR